MPLRADVPAISHSANKDLLRVQSPISEAVTEINSPNTFNTYKTTTKTFWISKEKEISKLK